MSPIYLDEKMDIRSVAVIGAGPCGLAAAKYLIAEKKFCRIEVFDQRAEAGGLWNYTSLHVVDRGFIIPRAGPTTEPDTAVWTEAGEDEAAAAAAGTAAQFVSPIYDELETNIPHTLMNYTDKTFPLGSALFPAHPVVRQYLHEYAEDLAEHLTLETQVLGVRKKQREGGGAPCTSSPAPPPPASCWEVETRHLRTKQRRVSQFDAVVVATGHYNDPFIPNIKGLAAFHAAYPGAVSHSKFYRRPDQFAGKKVIIVGHQASGIDLSTQIARVCQQPIIISEKAPPATAVEEKPWARMKPQISEFLVEDRTAVFSDGSVERGIDAVVFCTGYFYSFPFLGSLDPPVAHPEGARAMNLWEHLIYIDDPTLAFMGIPQRVVPLPVAEAQAAFVSRAWADRMPLPPAAEMRAWLDRSLQEKGESKFLHNLAFPRDAEYINRLHDASVAASPREGLENAGAGKIPPYWGADKAWVRERFPLIKMASRALGPKRHLICSLEELGFDYHAWKAANEAQAAHEAEAKLL